MKKSATTIRKKTAPKRDSAGLLPIPIKTPLKVCDSINTEFQEKGVRVRVSSWHSIQDNIGHMNKHIADSEAQIEIAKKAVRRLDKLLLKKVGTVPENEEVQGNGKTTARKPLRKRK